MMNDKVRVRFAPSPTGNLHVGNDRTALFNWLLAKNQGGSFLLRLEDTDIDRSTDESVEGILEDLEWLGLDWDEGFMKGGKYGPYRQMERLEIYRDIAHKLLKEKIAYYCYCSQEELDKRKNMALAKDKQWKYDRLCLDKSKEEIARHVAQGDEPVIRLKVDEAPVQVNDQIRGIVQFDANVLNDFIILRSDGRPSYNFAVVVDDKLMKITHVIRGEEHLSNTPKQVKIYQALGWTPPAFVHLPLILGPDRSKLTKRHGSTSIASFRNEGYLPEPILNYLSLLGWSPGTDEEILPMETIIKRFSLEKVSKSPAIFDKEKLSWMNGHYIRNLPTDSLAKLLKPVIQTHVNHTGDDPEWNDEYVTRIADAVKNKMKVLKDVLTETGFFFAEMFLYDNKALEILGNKETSQVIRSLLSKLENNPQASVKDFFQHVDSVKNEVQCNSKTLYTSIRIALTGKEHGVGLPGIINVLGVKEIEKRLQKALTFGQS